MEDHIARIIEALRKNHTIMISCHCQVRYSGRAESFLDYGDRIILIKSDNTLLVHQPTGNNPVNYMKPGCHFTFTEKDGELHLQATHQALKEHMDVVIKTIYSYHAHHLEESTTIVLDGTEKDMSDHLYAHPELIEEGFTPVNQEEQTQYGFIDLLGRDKEGVLCAVECKRYTGDFKAVDQLRRYVERLKQAKGITDVRGILACPAITPNALKMLQDFGFSHVAVEPPKRYDLHKKSQMSLGDFHTP